MTDAGAPGTPADPVPPDPMRPATPPASATTGPDEPAAAGANEPELAPAVPTPPAPVPAAAPASAAPALEPARTPPDSAPVAPAPPRRERPRFWSERPETPVDVPRARLSTQTRRDFLIFTAGVAAAAAGAWWLLPDRTKARLIPGGARGRLDTIAARVGLSRDRRERFLDRALTFDDDVAEALYSRGRRVRTYRKSEVTPLRNNYNGETPGPEYVAGWALLLTGLASGGTERLGIDALRARFAVREQVTRLVCVEGWSAVAWWGGISFAEFLAAFPPAPGARWASLRSAVNLSPNGDPDPYYVSIDLETARHPQTLLATHLGGQPLTVAHGAPLRLLVPMKLGLKNIKAVTDIAYTTDEPRDYWNERGYSKYDGL